MESLENEEESYEENFMDDGNPDETVVKVGEIDLSEIGFNEVAGTRVAVIYNGTFINEETSTVLYRKGGNMTVPVKVEVPRNVKSIPVEVRYDKFRKNTTVENLKFYVAE